MRVIAVGVDRRGDADDAVRWAATLAGRTASELHLVHSVAPGRPPGPWTQDDHALLEQARELAQSIEPTLVFDLHLSWEPLQEALTTAARSADILVVGARQGGGGSRPGGVPVGSLVAQDASCPVVVVPRGWVARDAGHARGGGYGVVACDDGSHRSNTTLQAAVELARGTDATLTIVHRPSTAEPVPAGADPPAAAGSGGGEPVRRLADVVQDIQNGSPGLHIRPGSFYGASASADVLAAAADADVVVVGGRAAGGTRRDPFDDTIDAVLGTANLPVMIVPLRSRSPFGLAPAA